MFGKSLSKQMQQLDLQRRIPYERKVSTTASTVLSYLALILMSILFVQQTYRFFSISYQSELMTDQHPLNQLGISLNKNDKFQINLDVVLYRMPCALVSFDIENDINEYKVNMQVTKTIVDKDGNYLMDYQFSEQENKDHLLIQQKAVDQISKNQGCRVLGSVITDKVPGNIHLSAHDYRDVLYQIQQREGYASYNLDLSHKILHFSFGPQKQQYKQIQAIKNTYTQIQVNSLDDKEQKGSQGTNYEYFMKVTASRLLKLDQTQHDFYQFTHNSQKYQMPCMPAVWFRFQMYPYFMLIQEQKMHFYQYLTDLFAILGGIYSLAFFIDMLIYRSLLPLIKKQRLSKLQ